MPRKSSDRTYGEKLVFLFARLLFTKRRLSLVELSNALDCSKQTVLRLIEDIERSYKVQVEWSMEKRKRFFRLKTPGQMPPALNLTQSELNTLYMCRFFAEHLLGRLFLEEATRALEKGHTLLKADDSFSSDHFASFRPGTIDYTPYQEAIRTVLDAMEKKIVCKISYKAMLEKRPKTFYIKPYKIFSHRETVYLHAGYSPPPGRRYHEADFNPLLAVHRIVDVALTDRFFKIPDDYDFEKTFNRNFGIIKGDTFEVEVEFSGFAAVFVSERVWSPDQKIRELPGDRIRLTFSASSDVELAAWILSFGDEALVIRPDWLREQIAGTIERQYKVYHDEKTGD